MNKFEILDEDAEGYFKSAKGKTMQYSHYIFDLDGTLANCEHRQHLVNGEEKDWDAFYKACVKDTPYNPIVNLYQQLQNKIYSKVYIWTGRSDLVYSETFEWLDKYIVFPPHDLRMRKEGDYRPDVTLKLLWLKELLSEFEVYKPQIIVFEDRLKVVKMYRDYGVTCLHVGGGDF